MKTDINIAFTLIFFLLGTIGSTVGNSPTMAAGAYIATSICLLANAIERASKNWHESERKNDKPDN